MPMTYTLKIWYRWKHDDYTVAEVYHQPDPPKQVRDLVHEGGFWAGPYFIPFHCISTIEYVEERGDASAPETKT